MEYCAAPAVELLRGAQIESIVVTNTVHLPPEKRLGKMTQLTVGPLLAAAIERIHSGESVGALFAQQRSSGRYR
jgi:ribose-phosphate pyrophosphokinase